MAEGDGLGGLQMGKPGHGVGRMLRGAVGQGTHQVGDLGHRARRSRRAPTDGNRWRPGRCGYGRYAAACRPRRCARSAATRCSCGYLRGPRRRRSARSRSRSRCLQTGADRPFIFRADDAGPASIAACASDPRDVLAPHFAVEADGGIDLFHDDGGPRLEASAPLGIGGRIPLLRRGTQGRNPCCEMEDVAPSGAGRRDRSGGNGRAQMRRDHRRTAAAIGPVQAAGPSTFLHVSGRKRRHP